MRIIAIDTNAESEEYDGFASSLTFDNRTALHVYAYCGSEVYRVEMELKEK